MQFRNRTFSQGSAMKGWLPARGHHGCLAMPALCQMVSALSFVWAADLLGQRLFWPKRGELWKFMFYQRKTFVLKDLTLKVRFRNVDTYLNRDSKRHGVGREWKAGEEVLPLEWKMSSSLEFPPFSMSFDGGTGTYILLELSDKDFSLLRFK